MIGILNRLGELQMKSAILVMMGSLVMAPLTAQAAGDAASHPCEQIKKACEAAGFIKGEAKQGNGLWVDCIDPVMRGQAQPKKATKPLPPVDAALVAACKAKHPHFGQGKEK